jgi:thiamine-monophosphate kinase
MAIGEFELIDRYFRALGIARPDVALGVGDDAAVLELPAGARLVAAVDTLVEDMHFPRGCDPRSVGHRALAVNLSDLAAMGARPAWCLLALTLPHADPSLLAAFADGLGALARRHGVALVGGDTTRGPFTVTLTALGVLEGAEVLRRSGARPGDLVFVSGTPGDAACGLAICQGRVAAVPPDDARALRERFLYPSPRVELGLALRDLATACIDVSDGLAGDLHKLAEASACAVEIDVEDLPVSDALAAVVGLVRARELALAGGDDYELAFTAPADRADALRDRAQSEGVAVRAIGRVTAGSGVVVRHAGTVIQVSPAGFDHFAG